MTKTHNNVYDVTNKSNIRFVKNMTAEIVKKIYDKQHVANLFEMRYEFNYLESDYDNSIFSSLDISETLNPVRLIIKTHGMNISKERKRND